MESFCPFQYPYGLHVRMSQCAFVCVSERFVCACNFYGCLNVGLKWQCCGSISVPECVYVCISNNRVMFGSTKLYFQFFQVHWLSRSHHPVINLHVGT